MSKPKSGAYKQTSLFNPEVKNFRSRDKLKLQKLLNEYLIQQTNISNVKYTFSKETIRTSKLVWDEYRVLIVFDRDHNNEEKMKKIIKEHKHDIIKRLLS